jgi:hypothetical protein
MLESLSTAYVQLVFSACARNESCVWGRFTVKTDPSPVAGILGEDLRGNHVEVHLSLGPYRTTARDVQQEGLAQATWRPI